MIYSIFLVIYWFWLKFMFFFIWHLAWSMNDAEWYGNRICLLIFRSIGTFFPFIQSIGTRFVSFTPCYIIRIRFVKCKSTRYYRKLHFIQFIHLMAFVNSWRWLVCTSTFTRRHIHNWLAKSSVKMYTKRTFEFLFLMYLNHLSI